MKSSKVVTGIIWIVLAIGFLAFQFNDVVGFFKPEVKLEDSLDKDIKTGTRISVGVDGVVDWYATLEHKRYGVKTSEDKYAMIWLDDNTFMGIKINGTADEQKIDEILNATYDYIDGKTSSLPDKVYFKGKLKKMEAKEKEYFQDLLTDMGYSESEFEDIARYYTIDTTVGTVDYVLMLGISGVFLLIGIIMIIVGLCTKNNTPKNTPKGYVVNDNIDMYQQTNMNNSPYQNSQYNPYGSNPNSNYGSNPNSNYGSNPNSNYGSNPNSNYGSNSDNGGYTGF